ncbi:Serine phosphatase RsbU, regulator of sigma subunit [Pseudomonas citronellolis]|uniref:Serine phosphatase RsbU, regulator of sigma subunit n=1 Tax=Pseudomonas citronellolis TaxID=53408 RepID=A0AAQ1KFR5_9PSED|nr:MULTISPECIES: biofilm regulation protein phosphatase SiaA [Pseudomonas]MCL6690023.1 biofilm regulation protein phosphatase SiaA [Pseudomonas sp. R3.Fl]MDN6872659.1 biofilm regulation protein phosphatase SiaA [Pseudomonas citronellolis]TGC28728.1 histidine kinase [Pseudomonas citronellolis]UUC50538.1 biofilm regulation protein phosphatase SiaA [Pseudomonas citronellolis]SFC90735.1 Serine phosphatase RsbU, regulator of sigma subunit [Pseudomonas citronellolis]
MAARWGLRGKSVVALLLACVLALVPAVLLGWKAMEDIRTHFGLAYAKNFTLLNQQKILAPVIRELSLSRRLAESVVTQDWLLDESSSERRTRFFREADGYRGDQGEYSYFVIVDSSLHYYFNDSTSPLSNAPRYTLSRDDPQDAWYFATMASDSPYNINVNYDAKLRATKVWFNVQVIAGNHKVGLAGGGLDLTAFLDQFISRREPGVTPMIVDADGAIQAHPDRKLIALSSGAGTADNGGHRVFDLLASDEERKGLRQVLDDAQAHPGEVRTFWATLDGKRQLLATAYIPELRWHVLSAVDLHAAQVLDSRWIWPLAGTLLGLLALLLIGFAYTVELLLLKPLRGLRQSAKAIAAGQYDNPLPKSRGDEIGELSDAFASMANQVRRHTEDLEDKVRQRTQALEQANREMAAAQKKIGDSIDYASLIQRAILPDRQLQSSLGQHHFVLWKPRDVVGGDFYIYREGSEDSLIGVVDCAGHGVPGALMTMLALAAIDHAIDSVQSHDPASILRETDQVMRGMISQERVTQALATNMDAGFVRVDHGRRLLHFSGAKISLFASNGDEVREYKGGRRAIGDKRQGEYENIQLPLEPGWTFYLCTDGFLDQAGGEHGFGFGNSRFAELLRRHSRLPLAEQARVFAATLADYQGERPQRDDITILSFRFE